MPFYFKWKILHPRIHACWSILYVFPAQTSPVQKSLHRYGALSWSLPVKKKPFLSQFLNGLLLFEACAKTLLFETVPAVNFPKIIQTELNPGSAILLHWNPALRTPRYYGQFRWSRRKPHTFSLKLIHLIRTPVNTDNGHFSVSQVTNSYTLSTPLYGHCLSVHCECSLS